jgi:ABC-2 type transport system ATP-binding protein
VTAHPAIELADLTRIYRTGRGVTGVSLVVPEGSLFGFLGPNGAGKTTTIRVLMALLRPTKGRANIFGLDCWSRTREIKQDVGYVPGDLRLHSWLTGREALSIFGRVRKRDLTRQGNDLARLLELDLGVRVREMSRGMRQKLGLILALAHEPRLLILDEPTSALDPLMQDRFRERLKSLAAAGHTVFFSSHTLSEVEAICDRVAIVKDGRLVADEPLASLRTRSGHQISVQFRRAGAAPIPPIPPIPGLRVTSFEAGALRATMEGPIEPVLRWLATQEVADVTIERPDLETLFRRFYQSDTPDPAGGAS